MNVKQIKQGDDSRLEIKKGVDIVADCVSNTLGPMGRNIVIEKTYGTPVISKDGITVAKEIKLEDKFENIGAQLTIEASQKTNDAVGDATTTCVVLTRAIFNAGMKLLATGINPITIKNSVEEKVKDVIKNLEKMSEPISTSEKITQVASISANDPAIGKIIAEAMESVGPTGVITVEPGQSFGVEKEVVEGMQIEKGFVSPYLITNQEKLTAELFDSHILITDKKITNIQEMIPILEKMGTKGIKKIVIIAESVEGDALPSFIMNKIQGKFEILLVNAPGFGTTKKEILKDICILTGATFITDETGMKFEDLELENLGKATKVVSTKDDTIIVGGQGNKANIIMRTGQIKKEIEEAESEFDKDKLKERLAKLSGGVAVIKVGAATETEMKEKRDRIEDALNATRAAIEEGIIPGGGLGLALASNALKESKELTIGEQIINKAILEPIRIIAENSGVDGSRVLYRIVQEEGTIGFNAATGEFEDMIKAGVVDPTKVVRSALENATSAALMMLTTQAVITEKPEPKKDEMAGTL